MQTVSLNRQKINDMRGFSLVEIIIVMLIMSVVMMAVMSLVVPTQRSSVIQSDLSTIQGGMQVALERMSKDFRNAGFLIAGPAVTGYPDDTTTNSEIVPVDASLSPLVINTRAVSGIFARIDTVPSSPSGSFSLIYPDQFVNFPVGSYAAVVEPLNADPLPLGAVNDYYYVMSSISGSVKLGNKLTHNELTVSEVAAFTGTPAGLLLLRIPSSRQPLIEAGTMSVLDSLNRTITYAHIDTDGDGNPDTLTRQVDAGHVSQMARGISELTFIVEEDGDGDVNKVTIDMVGEAEAVGAGNDAVSSAKTKRVRILIALRNV